MRVPFGRPLRVALLTALLAVPLALLVQRAAVREARRQGASLLLTAPASPWFDVHPADAAALDESRIGRVGFPGTRPWRLSGAELELPPGHPLAAGGVLIVETVVAPSGRIAKARLLRGDAHPALRARLVDCLRTWTFAPATYQGEAWAVGWNVTLPVGATFAARR
jgi:hypothetical protein